MIKYETYTVKIRSGDTQRIQTHVLRDTLRADSYDEVGNLPYVPTVTRVILPAGQKKNIIGANEAKEKLLDKFRQYNDSHPEASVWFRNLALSIEVSIDNDL